MIIASLPGIIKDGDITLRPLRISDGPFISKALRQDDILRSSGKDKFHGVPWLLLYFWIRKTFFLAYCIERRAERIGFIGFYNLVVGESANVSLVIFDSGNRRKGIGTRALQLLSRTFFAQMLTGSLIAVVRKDNPAALTFWKQLGFDTVGDDEDTIKMALRNRGMNAGRLKKKHHYFLCNT
jgi:RimJ/RimL family protein N-acetyltransferase